MEIELWSLQTKLHNQPFKNFFETVLLSIKDPYLCPSLLESSVHRHMVPYPARFFFCIHSSVCYSSLSVCLSFLFWDRFSLCSTDRSGICYVAPADLKLENHMPQSLNAEITGLCHHAWLCPFFKQPNTLSLFCWYSVSKWESDLLLVIDKQ